MSGAWWIAGEGSDVGDERMTDGAREGGTLVLRLGYRGAGFSGFAAQPGRRTVAGELTHALETLLRRKVELTCAGRTDAGVHAIAQYASIPMSGGELALPARRVMRALSALTPDDISVQELYRAAPGFSARFDARSRSYRYRICTGEARPVLAWDHAWWLRSGLDVSAMREAAPAHRRARLQELLQGGERRGQANAPLRHGA